jgi:hypothetical protein
MYIALFFSIVSIPVTLFFRGWDLNNVDVVCERGLSGGAILAGIISCYGLYRLRACYVITFPVHIASSPRFRNPFHEEKDTYFNYNNNILSNVMDFLMVYILSYLSKHLSLQKHAIISAEDTMEWLHIDYVST